MPAPTGSAPQLPAAGASPRQFGHHILARVLLLVAVGMLGPLTVLGWAGWTSKEELERHEVAELGAAAGFTALRAQDKLAAALDALETAAREAPQVTLDAEQLEAHRHAALRDAFTRHRTLFTEVARLDKDGAVLAREPQGGRPLDGAALIAEARRLDRAVISDLLPEAGGGRRAWAMVPVHSWDGKLAGLVVGAIDPRAPHLAELFKGTPPQPGGALDLVDSSGAVVTSTDPARLFTRDHPRLIAGLIQERRRSSETCAGCHTRAVAGPGRGLLAIAPLSVVHWAVALREPEPEAFSFTAALSRNLLGLLVVLLAIALLFAWGAATSVTRPLAALTSAAERLTAGELGVPIPSLDEDEVGRLGLALERMRLSLQQSLGRVERANAELEQRVAERTAALEQKSREQQADQERVRLLLSKVISAQEDERRRVARELHDETSSSLAAVVMRVQAAVKEAPPGELRARLEETQALAVHTLDEVHRQIRGLRPSVLDDLGLQSAIRWCAETSLEKRGIAVRSEFSGFTERLSPAIETVVFRVAQEAMTNIARHAQAESVLIQAAVKGNQLSLEIEDDGRGFLPERLAAPGSEGRGWGLLGMRERVEMLGGTLQIDSSPGQGTHLSLALPLSQ
jgi:signal transduction histidine kinase